MGAIDAQGVYIYDGSELGAPGATFQNLGQNAQSAALADVRADIAGLQLLVDSSWVVLSMGTGWVAVGSGYTPRIRKVGNRVDLFGAVQKQASGNIASIAPIPVGFRMTNSTYGNAFIGTTTTSTGSIWMLTMNVTTFQVAIAPGYGSAYAGGVPATNEVIPLVGSWYVN